MVKVSVIVAVYNPGQDIDKLLESLDAQSMPADEFEVIFADDDSTDGTRERLQEWARVRANVQVLHNVPNSGWPGRPRNLGIDAAKGEFVFFADNDDKFTPKALEWMYDYAHANGSDVVVPKEVGVGAARGVTGPIYRRNIPDAKLGRDPILGVLTPHKLVRTSLLREHGIRFPEGRVRLEDHYVITASYFAAKRISVLADKLCYYWMRRESGGGQNAQFSRAEPAVYYEGVARALEVVEANTKPGEFRNKLYSHWYNSKMLARLDDAFLARTPESRESLVAALRDVSARFDLDERILPHLGASSRARALLLQHGTIDDLCALARVNHVTSRVEIEDFSWTKSGCLSMSVRAQFIYTDSNEPIPLVSRAGRTYWDVAALGVPLDPIDVSDLVGDTRLDVLATDRGTHEMSYLKSQSKPVPGINGVAAVTRVVIDPAELFRGKPAGSIIDLRTRCTGLGWTSIVRIPVPKSPALPVEHADDSYGRIRAYGTQGHDKLSLRLLTAADPSRARAAQDARRTDVQDTVPGWGELAEMAARRVIGTARPVAGKVRRRIRGRARRR